MPKEHDYRPQFAPHVIGRYEERTFNEAAGMHNPQTIRMHCEKCDFKWGTVCSTGQVRSQIHKFAVRHLHRDPFNG